MQVHLISFAISEQMSLTMDSARFMLFSVKTKNFSVFILKNVLRYIAFLVLYLLRNLFNQE